MYWVTMTDKFASHMLRITNKVIMECETYAEAVIVEANCKNHKDMIYVNIRSTKPYYPNYSESWKNKKDYPEWFRAGYFN